jgi:protein phosphatase
VITRALGTDAEVDVDTVTVDVEPGDLFLLCSDGLTTMVPEEDILRIAQEADDLNETARTLVRAANSGGGEDNITVVLFKVEGDEATEETLVAAQPETVEEPEEPNELEDTLTDMPPVQKAEPAVQEPRPRRRRSHWGRRILWGALGLAFVALILGGALFGLSRAYFVGADEEGNVTVYQGVPFDFSDGVGLYRERYVSRLQAAQLSPEERAELFDHELVSYDRALERVEAYEAEAVP